MLDIWIGLSLAFVIALIFGYVIFDMSISAFLLVFSLMNILEIAIGMLPEYFFGIVIILLAFFVYFTFKVGGTEA
jgi:hypothetical protein